MFVTHQEMLGWLAIDAKNVDRFIRSLEKIMKGHIILVFNDKEDLAITSFRAFNKTKKVKR
jgi:hypothetical protein